ncbi:MAG TPA: MFS transporter [Candidatus Limnocylindria bacterium]|nr:MFS transporter [Candidatus Limnocylindria bacterium]
MSRPFFLLLAVAAAITTTKGATELVLPPYLDAYGYSLELIGALASLVAVVQLGSRLPVGLAYRAEQAKRQFALALVAFGVSVVGLGLARGDPAAIVALSALHGLAFGSVTTLGLALIIDLTGGKRAGRSMAWYTAANSLGYALGALGGGAVADRAGLAPTLAVVGWLPFAAALALRLLPALEGAPLPTERGAGVRGVLGAIRDLDPRVWVAFVIVVYINVIADSVDTFFPVYAPAVGIPLATVGLLRAFKSGAAIFIRSTGPLFLGAVDHRVVTVVAIVASAAATAALPLSTSTLVLIAIFIVLGLTRGVLRATSAAQIAEIRGEGRDVGLASGVYNSGLDLGTIVGPLVGGVIAGALGIPAMFQIVAAASLAAWLAVQLATMRARARARSGQMSYL